MRTFSFGSPSAAKLDVLIKKELDSRNLKGLDAIHTN